VATKFLAASVSPGAVTIVGRGPDDIDAQLTAIGDDLDTAVDSALAVTEIDAEVNAEVAVEAIRTAVDAALVAPVADRALMASGTVVVRYDTTAITSINQLVAAFDSILRHVQTSGL
jgi:hypothetical protein